MNLRSMARINALKWALDENRLLNISGVDQSSGRAYASAHSQANLWYWRLSVRICEQSVPRDGKFCILYSLSIPILTWTQAVLVRSLLHGCVTLVFILQKVFICVEDAGGSDFVELFGRLLDLAFFDIVLEFWLKLASSSGGDSLQEQKGKVVSEIVGDPTQGSEFAAGRWAMEIMGQANELWRNWRREIGDFASPLELRKED